MKRLSLRELPPEIPPIEPFAFDRLDRKPSADALTDLVTWAATPLTLAIDGAWGAGKTTFLRMWAQQLRNRGLAAFYHNAWENDFASDPFVAVATEIRAALRDHCPTARLEALTRRARQLVWRAGPRIAKALARRLVDADDVSDAVAEALEDIAAERLRRYEHTKQDVDAFRGELARLAAELEARRRPLPIVCLIDELDRCRPEFGIALLEDLKHIFGVPGFVFAIAVDKRQLGCSLRMLYGAEVDTEAYLRRFFDLEFRLPAAAVDAYVAALLDRWDVPAALEGRASRSADEVHLREVLGGLAGVFHLSLRDAEKCVGRAMIALRSTGREHGLHGVLLSALLVLKLARPRLYEEFADGRIGARALLDEIARRPGGHEFLDRSCGAALEAYLFLCQKQPRPDASPLARYLEQARDGSLGASAQRRFRRKLAAFEETVEAGGEECLPNLHRRIELLDRFV